MIPEIRDDRQMRALTGVPTEKFSTLEAAFALALEDDWTLDNSNKPV